MELDVEVDVARWRWVHGLAIPICKFLSQALHFYYEFLPEAVARRCSAKKVFLKIFQNSLENTCVGVSFLIKLQV